MLCSNLSASRRIQAQVKIKIGKDLLSYFCIFNTCKGYICPCAFVFVEQFDKGFLVKVELLKKSFFIRDCYFDDPLRFCPQILFSFDDGFFKITVDINNKNVVVGLKQCCERRFGNMGHVVHRFGLRQSDLNLTEK